MSAHLLRQDFIPMVAGYLIIMAALATGLGLHRRSVTGAQRPPAELPAGPAAPAVPSAPAVPAAPGPTAWPSGPLHWGRLARHVAGTAVGGYLLLIAVVIGYYYGVARVSGAFIKSAFTGCALLIGLAVPLFAALSWATERWRARRGSR